MDNIEPNLTKKQLKAIPVVLQAKSVNEGVKKAGISKTTFYEWLKNPAFKIAFSKQQEEVIDLALCELKASTGEAVAVLRELLGSKNEHIKLRAAQTILDATEKFIGYEKIEARLEGLERSMQR